MQQRSYTNEHRCPEAPDAQQLEKRKTPFQQHVHVYISRILCFIENGERTAHWGVLAALQNGRRQRRRGRELLSASPLSVLSLAHHPLQRLDTPRGPHHKCLGLGAAEAPEDLHAPQVGKRTCPFCSSFAGVYWQLQERELAWRGPMNRHEEGELAILGPYS